jgi:hypothetical protein
MRRAANTSAGEPTPASYSSPTRGGLEASAARLAALDPTPIVVVHSQRTALFSDRVCHIGGSL